MATTLDDLTGRLFGRWTVMRRGTPVGEHPVRWLCRCDCGTERMVLGGTLRRGESHSCRCLSKELTIARQTKHGESVLSARTTEYTIWTKMIARCENQRDRGYPLYGGRGITVCDRWRDDFTVFLSDVGRRPSLRHSIDRYPDPHGNYEPSNIRWATSLQQGSNRRNVRLRDVNGDRISAKSAAKHLAMARTSFRRMIGLEP